MQRIQVEFSSCAPRPFSGGRRSVLACALAFVALIVAPALPAATADTRPLPLLEAVRLADAEAPAISARRAAVESANDAVTPAGALPDPQLVAGIDNLPVNGNDAFSLTNDFMTMRKIGVMQEIPGGNKRQLRTERAQAAAAREQALLASERLSVRESVARAWIARSTAERRLELLKTLQPRAEAEVTAAVAALSSGRGAAADALAAKAAQAIISEMEQAKNSR